MDHDPADLAARAQAMLERRHRRQRIVAILTWAIVSGLIAGLAFRFQVIAGGWVLAFAIGLGLVQALVSAILIALRTSLPVTLVLALMPFSTVTSFTVRHDLVQIDPVTCLLSLGGMCLLSAVMALRNHLED